MNSNQPNPHQRTVIQKRPADERGVGEHGWLHARFTFSFANYFDPDHMGFRALRVMNNDTIEPGGGFPMHPHSDAEIFTYVMSGSIQHKDNQGNGAIVTAGNLQYMSAGSGILHSEFNPSNIEQTELYQIWLRPNESGGVPKYSEKQLGDAATPNQLTLLFSGRPNGEATQIRQDAEIYFGRLEAGITLDSPGSPDLPHSWLQVIQGKVSVFGETLSKGDGLAVSNHTEPFPFHASEATDVLLFKLN